MPVAPVVPRLRDQHGQSWPWPPLAPEGAGAEGGGFLLPDGVSRASRCWLVFLPGAFTPVCTRELGWMGELTARLASGAAEDAVALRVISCDPAQVLRWVAEDAGLGLDDVVLLSDFWPHGAAAQALGEFDAQTGRAHRSSVLVDAHGAVVRRVRSGAGEERSLDAHL